MIEIDIAKMLHAADGPLTLELQATLGDGERAALFGPSGAGKTTVLRLLAGLARPDRGSIIVDGRCWFDSARRIDLPTRQRSIGFVFQDHALFPHLTVRGNVAYAAAKGDAGWIDELLALTGLDGLQQRLPHTLSGGQKQRVALARALTRKPSLLLLDEPLSALDAESRSRMQDDLLRLHERLGFTALLVSHDIAEVFKLAQRTLLLDAGRVLQAGTPAEIFLRRRLAGRLQLHAQVLAVRREEVVHVVSLLVGQEIIDVLASDDEAANLQAGDIVSVSAKAISPVPAGNRG